jgi:GAF domain-containing protein
MTALDGAAVGECERAVQRLLAATAASRVTLRLEDDGGGFPVVAEACAEGVLSLRAQTGIDLRGAATFIALERDRRVLVQEDLERADPAPPPALINQYGARAQMLAPLSGGGRLRGIVSVHESAGPRRWRPQDVDALIAATGAIAHAVGADAPAHAVGADAPALG